MNIEFENLTFTATRYWRDSNPQTILHGVHGCFRPGELSAIMGPSGAGKSTLLNILSGYNTQGVSGTIKVNGQLLNRRQYQKRSRYITQDDNLPILLTTHEAMMVAADLKLSHSTTAKQKLFIIDDILSVLGLTECAQTRTEMLSGGQKKRLSVALEMINNPSVFYLDEPTSGLDNFSTLQCLRILSTLARQGRTIVCTIHQPSASLFQMFDQVYVLGKGRCVYQGAAEQLVPFLSSVGFHCPTHYNPADYVIEVTDSDDKNVLMLSDSIQNGRTSHTSTRQQTERFQTYITQHADNHNTNCESNSNECETCTCGYDERHKLDTQGTRFGYDNNDNSEFPINCWQQFVVLFCRMAKQIWRNKTALQIQIFHHLLCGFAVGGIFFNAANDGYQMFSHMKFCVGYVMFHAYTNLMVPILTFPTEVQLLKREHFNRWYRLTPYYTALMCTKLPPQLSFGLIFSVIVYFMCGLPAEIVRFSYFAFVGILVTMCSDSIGIAIGAIFNVTNGAAVGPAVIAPFLGLACYGFDFARDISWLTYAIMKLSFMRNGVVATVVAVFGYGRKTLECLDIYCHFKEPSKILHFVYLEDVSIWNEYLSIALLMVFFRIVSILALHRRLAFK